MSDPEPMTARHQEDRVRGRSAEVLWLGIRSLTWTALVPGVVAGYLPWRYFGVSEVDIEWTGARDLPGVICIGVGAALLAACIWQFARRGRGTLAPVDPPRVLVVTGLYRYVRNPMYLSVTMIVLGEALLTGSLALLAYWAAWFGAVNVFVLAVEEPALRSRFGESYVEYTRTVGRWLPRFRSGGSSR